MQLGVALLPRRCAESEIGRGELVALAMPEIRLRRRCGSSSEGRRAIARVRSVLALSSRSTSKKFAQAKVTA